MEDSATTERPRTSFLSLPFELREQVYKIVALDHTTRRIYPGWKPEGWDPVVEYSKRTSALSATCRLISSEYEKVARKAVEILEFEVWNLNFSLVMGYFRSKISRRHLKLLQNNGVTIKVKLMFDDYRGFAITRAWFCAWAAWLDDFKLPVEYAADANICRIIDQANRTSRGAYARIIAENSKLPESTKQAARDFVGAMYEEGFLSRGDDGDVDFLFETIRPQYSRGRLQHFIGFDTEDEESEDEEIASMTKSRNPKRLTQMTKTHETKRWSSEGMRWLESVLGEEKCRTERSESLCRASVSDWETHSTCTWQA